MSEPELPPYAAGPAAGASAPTPPPASPPPAPVHRRRGSGRAVAWLLVLGVIALAAWGGWNRWQHWSGVDEAVETQQELLARMSRELASLRAESQELDRRHTDLAQAVQKNGADIATTTGRLDDSEETLARVTEVVQGGRSRVQLAAVEQLLLLANDRLILARDVETALAALDLADKRLATISDPRLYRVREALASERAALAALPRPDVAGTTLALGEIVQRARSYPLKAQVPDSFQASTDAAGEEPEDAGWLKRVWASVRGTVSGLYTIRRTDGLPPRLLGAEQEALVREALQLKLEGARLALLAGDPRAFFDLVAAARSWLVEYYSAADPAVQAAVAELERVAKLELAPKLPEIDRSLALLRAHLEAAPR